MRVLKIMRVTEDIVKGLILLSIINISLNIAVKWNQIMKLQHEGIDHCSRNWEKYLLV